MLRQTRARKETWLLVHVGHRSAWGTNDTGKDGRREYNSDGDIV